jgi:hypothetical protein
VGDFTGQYRLDVSDVDLPGAVSRSLLVSLRGSVIAVPEPSTLVLAVLALGCGRWWLRRRVA